MDGLTTRWAGPGDLEALLVLQAEYAVADGHPTDPETARAGFGPLLTDDSVGVVRLAQLGEDVIGYAVVTWGWSIEAGGADVVLDELYVRPRGQGIGDRLLTEIETTCRARDVKRIFLETERPNRAARRFYARRGWREDDSIWMSKELV